MPTSHPPSALQTVAVVGAGAVGSYYGALLARAGHRVTLIGRAAHVQAIRQQGLRLLGASGVQTQAVNATIDLAGAQGAGLVLVCVKSFDTEAVARELAPWLAADALVLSLQNGVHNAATLARHLPQAVAAGVVYAAVAAPAAGVVQHLGGGDLVIGPASAELARDAAHMRQLQAVAQLFSLAGVPVRIATDVTTELWRKLVVNCAWNAASALTQASYAQVAALPAMRALQQAAVREAVAVARADGHDLDLDATLAAVQAIGRNMPAQRSSTAQDLARGRRTEIDHLNGHIARRGAVLGVATPVNQALHALVKLAEATHAAGTA